MMNDKDLKRNASGYVDEPCYKAVTAPPRPGEIWIHSKSGAQLLVLANVNGVCPTLRLVDVSGEGSIPVTGKAMMYVKPCMIGYCFDNLLSEYVKSIKGEEMAAIRKGIAKVMGLTADGDIETTLIQKVEVLEGNLQAVREENIYLRTENKILKTQLEEEKSLKTESDLMKVVQKEHAEVINRLDQEIVKLSIYKDMYMDIIDKLVSMREGAVNE